MGPSGRPSVDITGEKRQETTETRQTGLSVCRRKCENREKFDPLFQTFCGLVHLRSVSSTLNLQRRRSVKQLYFITEMTATYGEFEK